MLSELYQQESAVVLQDVFSDTQDYLMENLPNLVVAVLIILVAILVGYIIKRAFLRICDRFGVDEFTEGTAFERTAESFGTSTVRITATTIAWFIYLTGILIAIQFMGYRVLLNTYIVGLANFIPNIIIAAFILIFGAVIADKMKVVVSERLESVKIAEVGIIPKYVKYSILFVAFLMSLSQLGVSTLALHILLASYLIGVLLITVVSLRGMLPSFMSGMYIHITQPYKIGDTIKVGDKKGIVQEIDMYTTHIEDEEYEYIIPNYEIFEKGVSRELQE